MTARFVLDASVTLAWCFEDEANACALDVLDLLEESAAVAPALWVLEVGNALLEAECRGRLTQAESQYFLGLLHGLPIQLEEIPQTVAWDNVLSLARIHQLSAYDAVYLELALRLNLPLATLDEALRQAANQCGVKVLVL
ncbi:MAG: type II toxin-antitoxin system VapC family toxin [Anaerolineales bacterium]|nr:type II toxin-antitoxin system VapC family toxin [Anaerolineales bacterium]MDW8162533.1 type II toxin-antitoxin system VapC family toxin [Anaerolineales bacterium]